MSYEYKNGYNRAIEDMLKWIDPALREKYEAHESIYSVLLRFKNNLLDIAFSKGVCASEHERISESK